MASARLQAMPAELPREFTSRVAMRARELDVFEAHVPDRGQRAVRIRRHRIANGEELQGKLHYCPPPVAVAVSAPEAEAPVVDVSLPGGFWLFAGAAGAGHSFCSTYAIQACGSL